MPQVQFKAVRPAVSESPPPIPSSHPCHYLTVLGSLRDGKTWSWAGEYNRGCLWASLCKAGMSPFTSNLSLAVRAPSDLIVWLCVFTACFLELYRLRFRTPHVVQLCRFMLSVFKEISLTSSMTKTMLTCQLSCSLTDRLFFLSFQANVLKKCMMT